MPIQIPLEYQTPKLNSLSGKARQAVEELIAQKFDLGEVIEPDDYGQKTWTANIFSRDLRVDEPVISAYRKLDFHLYSYACNARGTYTMAVSHERVDVDVVHYQARQVVEILARDNYTSASALLDSGLEIEVDGLRCRVRNDNDLRRLAYDLCYRDEHRAKSYRFM